MTLHEFPAPLAKIKTCPRCQQPFACHPGHCWCTHLWIPNTILHALKQNYTDCLCQPCLLQLGAHPLDDSLANS